MANSTLNGKRAGAHVHGPHCNHAVCELRIRLFKTEDYKALKEIWRLGDIELDDTDSPAALAKNTERLPNGFRVFVAEAQELDHGDNPTGKARVAGGVILTYDGKRAYIYHFAVHPDFRGHGLGKALLETCERQAALWGARHLRLTARNDRSREVAHRMYQAAGWTPTKALWIYNKALKRSTK